MHPVEQGDLVSNGRLASTRRGVGQAKVRRAAADDSHVVETPLTALSCLDRNRSTHSTALAEVCYTIYTSSMALSIKSDEADRLARELAAETGESLTEAVVVALRERLDREHTRHAASMRTRLKHLAADVAAMRVADGRTPEEIIGYDEAGLPR